MANTFYGINDVDGTGSIGLFVGQQFVTEFRYENSQITLLPREKAEVTRKEFLENHSTINQWISLVEGRLDPERLPRSPYKLTTKLKADGTFSIKFEVNGVKITDLKINGDRLSYKARDAVTLNWSDFVFWRIVIMYLVTEEFTR